MVLTEFDPNKTAVINAYDCVKPLPDFPKTAVSCFSHITFERLVNALSGVKIAELTTANMQVPVYRVRYKNIEAALFLSLVGAAACVGILEDIFVLGAETVILFGTCGVLHSGIGDCSLIIPDFAVRDEGTSFHYAPSADEIAVNLCYRDEFIRILQEHRYPYTVGKVWTTDAMYRETREKTERRKKAGCICVDMECSAVAAAAAFRNKRVFHFFYAADNLDGGKWEPRSLSNTANVSGKDMVAFLAMELAATITEKESVLK